MLRSLKLSQFITFKICIVVVFQLTKHSYVNFLVMSVLKRNYSETKEKAMKVDFQSVHSYYAK